MVNSADYWALYKFIDRLFIDFTYSSKTYSSTGQFIDRLIHRPVNSSTGQFIDRFSTTASPNLKSVLASGLL
ncbi:hypothetical protein Ddc_13938 [Ditylenchus destructor]|nr:hypothetical protein Ddc_13938 [Ditylenchus destructor]